MMTKKQILFGLWAGILVNVVMAWINFDRGGWWLAVVPGNAAGVAACAWAMRRGYRNQWRGFEQ